MEHIILNLLNSRQDIYCCSKVLFVGISCVLVVGTDAIIVTDYVGAVVSKPVIFTQSKTDQFAVHLAFSDFSVMDLLSGMVKMRRAKIKAFSCLCLWFDCQSAVHDK